MPEPSALRSGYLQFNAKILAANHTTSVRAQEDSVISRPLCFVLMPFGEKPDPERARIGRGIDTAWLEGIIERLENA